MFQPSTIAALVVAAVAPAAQAARVVYSVGTNTGNLLTGTPDVTVAGGVATFTSAQADDVGVGDEVRYGGSVSFISGRIDATRYELSTATGGLPANVTSVPVTSIHRAFSSLAEAEADSPDGAHLGTSNLVAGDYRLEWACYGDGPDTEQVTLDGYTTGSSNYIRIFTPTDPDEVGVSQRHSGRWTPSAYRMEIGARLEEEAAIYVLDRHVRIEGIQLRRTAVAASFENSGIWFHAETTQPAEYHVHDNVLWGVTTATDWHVGIQIWRTGGPGSLLVASNNIVHDFAGNNLAMGFWLADADFTTAIYNNTVHRCELGYEQYAGPVVVVNCIAQDCDDGFVGSFSGGTGNNVSDLANDAPGTSSWSSTTVQFADEAGDDFHLARADSGARDRGRDLSADGVFAFTGDVDGRPRLGPWDIGADEAARRRVMVVD